METAKLLVHHIFKNYGLPEDIVSDRGTLFSSYVWHAFSEKLGISVSLMSGYHTQVNGQAKRVNQELGHFLWTNCSREQHHWSEFLTWVDYTQNSQTHTFTNLTVFQCILGYQPPLSSHGQGKHQMSQLWTSGSTPARRYGKGHTFVSREQYTTRNFRPICEDALTLPTNQARWFGSPLKTSNLNSWSEAKPSVHQAFWDPTQSLPSHIPVTVALPLLHISPSLFKPHGNKPPLPLDIGTIRHRCRGLHYPLPTGFMKARGKVTIPGRLGRVQPRGEMLDEHR